MKKVVLLILTLILITGCKEKIEKFHIDDKYYNEGKFIQVTNLDNLKKDSYVLYTYNNFCTFGKPCEETFKEYMEKYKIDFVSIPFEKFKNTSFYPQVKYGPSIIIVKKGKIVTYLNANKDSDKEKYQDINQFEKWIDEYIYKES